MGVSPISIQTLIAGRMISAAIQPIQGGFVPQHDSSRGRHFDRGTGFEQGERSGNGLNRQAKAVGNAWRDIRSSVTSGDALGHLQEKAHDPLLRVLGEQQDVSAPSTTSPPGLAILFLQLANLAGELVNALPHARESERSRFESLGISAGGRRRWR